MFVAFMVLLFLCTAGYAAATGYAIHSLSSDITVTPEGVYEIVEDIGMDFSTPLHGFYRVIPVKYRFDDPNQKDINVHVMDIRASDTVNVSQESDYLTIRVGDADRTVVGAQQYRIAYTYDIGADRNDGYDEFYFNLVGEYWEVPIDSFSFSIHFPSSIDKQSIWLTRGVWGSTSAEGVTWNLSDDGTMLSGRVSRLLPGEALTVRVQMPEGYYEKRPDYQAGIAGFDLWVYLSVIALASFVWYRYGRDDDLIIVPQFTPPEGMTPLDMGYIIDGTLDPRDVTSMIFYWADKGCLTIVEKDKKFSFIKGHDPTHASAHERQLFDAFFRSGKNGVVNSSDLEGKFYTEYQKLAKSISRYYHGERALSSRVSRNMASLSALLTLIPAIGFALVSTANYPGSLTLVIVLVSLAFGMLFALLCHMMMRIWHLRKNFGKVAWTLLLLLVAAIACPILGLFPVINDVGISFAMAEAAKTVVCIASVAFFSIITCKRSDYGQKQIERILGFRDFIDKVELDKLKRMIDDDPEYYYHILSFAIVMGLEKKWAKKFASITLEPPMWYVGSYDVWNVIFLSSMLNRCNNTLLPSVSTAPKASPGGHFGGSSFGGGGFSGGGFGGGGGGAW